MQGIKYNSLEEFVKFHSCKYNDFISRKLSTDISYESSSETLNQNIIKFQKLDKSIQNYIIDLGMNIENIISNYAIDQEEILDNLADVAKFVHYTRIKSIKEYLFKDDRPRMKKELL